MTPLNKVIKKYLDYLEIETRSFGEKAWRRAGRRIHVLLRLGVEQI